MCIQLYKSAKKEGESGSEPDCVLRQEGEWHRFFILSDGFLESPGGDLLNRENRLPAGTITRESDRKSDLAKRRGKSLPQS